MQVQSLEAHSLIAVQPGDGLFVSARDRKRNVIEGANHVPDINLCVGALFAGVWIFLLPRHDPRPGVPAKNRISEIDYVGTILIAGAFVSGVMAINFGGSTYAWNSGRIIGLFVVGYPFRASLPTANIRSRDMGFVSIPNFMNEC